MLRLIGYGIFYQLGYPRTVLDLEGPATFELALSLPAGRVVGASVIARHYNFFYQRFLWDNAVFDEALSARFLTDFYSPLPGVDLFMTGPDGGPEGWVFVNGLPGDVVRAPSVARMRFCVVGEMPEATLTAHGASASTGAAIAPDDALVLTASANLTVSPLVGVHVRVGEADYVNTTSASEGDVRVTLARSLPPGAEVAITDVPARDDFGRPLAPATYRLRVLNTTDVVRDLTFTEAPPPGSVVTNVNAPEVRDGALRLITESSPSGAPFSILVALGDVGSARHVRIRTIPWVESTEFRLVNATGERIAAPTTWASGRTQTRDATLPMGGVWWLSIHDEHSWGHAETVLDEIVLE